MYTLTLTGGERDAFDWVGHRYNNGDKMADILRSSDVIVVVQEDANLEDDEFDYWNEPGDVTFRIPEHKAWEMRDMMEEEDGFWPCFSSELASKMQSFLDKIV